MGCPKCMRPVAYANAALRQVDGKGFCKQHRKEADVAAPRRIISGLSPVFGLTGHERVRSKMDNYQGNNKRGFATMKKVLHRKLLQYRICQKRRSSDRSSTGLLLRAY